MFKLHTWCLNLFDKQTCMLHHVSNSSIKLLLNPLMQSGFTTQMLAYVSVCDLDLCDKDLGVTHDKLFSNAWYLSKAISLSFEALKN